MPSSFKWQVDTSGHPSQIFNTKLYFSIFIFGLLGAARGYDEGNISGNIVLPAFKDRFGLNDVNKSQAALANLQSNITSMVQLGSIGGALLAIKTVDYFGRVRAMQLVCLLWIIGTILQMTSTHVGQLYAGRIIEGLAIGQTTSIGPVYLVEMTPSPIRGLTNSIFAANVYFSVMLGYFANYGCALHIPAFTNNKINDDQWIYTLIPKIILAAFIFVSSLLCTESPRWLMKMNRTESALQNLSRIRNLPTDHPYVMFEISDINEQIMAERQAKEDKSVTNYLKEVIFKKSIAYRFFVIAIGLQLIAQWSGANAITIYASELFSLAGIKGDVNQLKMSAVLGVVKFVAAYICAFFIIDISRKGALYIGVTLQMVCILYFAIYLTIIPQAAVSGSVLSPSEQHASKAALAAIYLSGAGWTTGFNIAQYLIGAEIFPLNIRSMAQSMVMVLHFANQYGNSKALPKMMIAMKPYGTFYFFTGICLIGLVYAFFLPDLHGRSLESIEEVFTLPWYKLRRCNKLIPDHSQMKCSIMNGSSHSHLKDDYIASAAMNKTNIENSMEDDKYSKIDV